MEDEYAHFELSCGPACSKEGGEKTAEESLTQDGSGGKKGKVFSAMRPEETPKGAPPRGFLRCWLLHGGKIHFEDFFLKAPREVLAFNPFEFFES
jgi:hypothetical protein